MDLVRCNHRDKKRISDCSSSSSGLSEDLLINILARLPCRAATRFKLVCKHWCSLISSDYFITFFNHLRHGHDHHDHGHGGVDNSRCKFLVLRVYLGEVGTPRSRFQIDVFSSEEGEWRSHRVSSPNKLPNYHIGNIVPYKGMLHWLNFPYIVVFDPYNASGSIISRVIELRKYRIHSHGIFPDVHNICVWQDRLRVSYLTDMAPRHHLIWELVDYNKEKWKLKSKILITSKFLSAAYVHPDGTMVTQREKNPSFSLCTYDFQSRTIDDDVENVKYDLIVPDGSEYGLQDSVNVHRIDDPYQWWPTPVDQNHLYRG